nr:VapC toxin family PIN domain ribonuclease [Rugamonas fusca]
MNGVLVDTSVWVDHFRHHNAALAILLDRDMALTHPMIIGEIACGTPPAPRARTLRDMGRLQMVQHASVRETMAFIGRESVEGMRTYRPDLAIVDLDHAGRAAMAAGPAPSPLG